MKLDQIVTHFFSYLLTEKRVSQNTYHAYHQDVLQLCEYFARNEVTTVGAITVSILKQFIYYLHDINLKARTIARKMCAIKVFCTYLHKHHNAPDFAHELVSPKVEKSLPKYLSEEEVVQLFHEVNKDNSPIGMRNKTMLYLLYTSGMRISELTTLKLSDIRYDIGTIMVHGKGGKHRMIPLPQHMMQLLLQYVTQTHKTFEVQNQEKTDILFPVRYGKRLKAITRQAFWMVLKDLWKRLGYKRTISPHQLRHSLATHLLKEGVHLRSLQLLLGHENITTVQIYTHVEVSHIRTVYDKKHPRS